MNFSAIQFITDDTAAKAFLACENMLAAMVPTGGFDHAFATWRGNQGAYCAASFDTGHADPSGNGYIVLVIPEMAATIEEAADMIAEFRAAGKRDPDGPEINIMATIEPALN